MFRRLVHDTRRLLDAWWRVDRIRIAPREGELLRLRPPSIIVVEGCPAEVLARTVGQSVGGPYVEYECRSATDACRLRVQPAPAGGVLGAQWQDRGPPRRVDPERIEVFLRG